MSKNDLFYKEIEGKLDELKARKPKEEKVSFGEKLNKIFIIALGLMILVGLIFTLIGAFRK